MRLLDLVDLCDKQVRIYSDPIFGNLTADSLPHQVKQEVSSKLSPPTPKSTGSFATSIDSSAQPAHCHKTQDQGLQKAMED